VSLPVIVLLCTSILWGLSWLPLKTLNENGFGGLSLIFISFGFLSLFLTPVFYQQRKGWAGHNSRLFIIAFFGGAANLAFAYALIYGDTIRVMVLFYLLPIWGVLGGRILLHEKIDRWRWLGVVLAIAGAFTVLGALRILQQPPSWIDLISLAAGFFLAMSILSFRAIQQIHIISKIAAMFYGCFALAAIAMLLAAEPFIVGNSTLSWAGLLAYTFLWLLLANLGSQWAVSNMETGRASIIIILELVTAVVSATIIRGEAVTLNEALGGILILTAALIEALRDLRDKPAA
jgi:drug/metabolite transporter (DMT)-like permease